MVAWAQIVAGLVSAGTAAPTDSDALELYAGGNLSLYGGGNLELYGDRLSLYAGGSLELYAGGSLELYGSGAPTAFDSVPIIFQYIL